MEIPFLSKKIHKSATSSKRKLRQKSKNNQPERDGVKDFGWVGEANSKEGI